MPFSRDIWDNVIPALQTESVCFVSGLIQTAGDVVVHFSQVVDDHIQGNADYFGVKLFCPGGGGDVEEYVVIGAYHVFHDGVMGIEVIQESHEGLPCRPFGGSAQMNPKKNVHTVVRDDCSHQLVVLSGGNGGHEDRSIIGVMHIPALEKIQPLCLCIVVKNVSFQIFLRFPWGNGMVSAMFSPFCTVALFRKYLSLLYRMSGEFENLSRGTNRLIGIY